MSQNLIRCVLAGATTAVLLSGCHHKTDAKSELEKAVSVLAQTENTPQTPAPAPVPQPAPAVQSSTPAEPVVPPQLAASQQMQEALAAYKTGQLEDAVTRLHKLRATPTLTAEQRMAVNDSVAAVMNEIYEMAAKGDVRAIAAVRQYEEMQTAPRH